MNVVSKVEPIVKRIGPDLGAKYITTAGANTAGRPYIDAADFIFERPDGTQARVCVEYADCIHHERDRTLEDLVRAKVEAAINNSTH